MTRRILFALCLLASTLGAARVSSAAAIATGRWEYRFSWNGIPAASAAIDVTQERADDRSVYKVETSTRTNAFVDLFWQLRGHVESRFDEDLTPLGFRFDRQINRQPEVTEISFRTTEPRATGSHERAGQTKVVDVEDEVLDPITAIFTALQQPIAPGSRLQYDVFTGDARYLIELTAVGREVIHVDAGTFDALRLEPRIWKVGHEIEPRLRGATIWISDGPVRMPLRVRTEVFIGAVNADLQRVTAATGTAL